MSDLTRATRRNIPEDALLHSSRRENLKSYLQKQVYEPVTCFFSFPWLTAKPKACSDLKILFAILFLSDTFVKYYASDLKMDIESTIQNIESYIKITMANVQKHIIFINMLWNQLTT
jgi:hypothetical protein